MNLRTRVKTDGNMIVEQTSSDHAGEFVIECDASKVIAQGLLTASVSASLTDLPLATTSSQGLMSREQAAVLNLAVTSFGHDKIIGTQMLTSSNTTTLHSVAIIGLSASCEYQCLLGTSIAMHQSGSGSNCGFADATAMLSLTTNTSGSVNATTLQTINHSQDSTKLYGISSAAAIISGTSTGFAIQANGVVSSSIYVDEYEYWIARIVKKRTV